jgi:UDP-N-acetylglucosamine 2-epimerase
MQNVVVTFGTRPEAIKMASVVGALRRRPEDFRTRVCVTGQHREMLDQVLARFELEPDVDLDLMRPGQTPAQVTARVLEAMTTTLRDEQADLVVVQGDTTTAMATALAAFYLEIPVAHVEAGLRSGRLDAPFPEEMNRIVIDSFAQWVFPPTADAAENLTREGIPTERALITGNTAIDALLDLRSRLGEFDLPVREQLADAGRVVLVTAHRRESFGEPLRRVFSALQQVAAAHPDVTFVYPVHPNPQVLAPAHELLTAPNIRLMPPVDYAELVWLLDRAELVLTDSGGLQEEAPTLGTPLLVLRDVTERPAFLAAGAGLLVGTDPERIVTETARLLTDAAAHAAMGRPRMLYGDGHAGTRIAAALAGDPVTHFAPPPEALS